jgi:ribosomal protein S18 acetylase RimI-like enzyme
MPTLTITPYHPKYNADFERLNRDWLEAYFEVEPIDEAYFNNPQGMILDKGGKIWFIQDGDNIVGTAAWIPHTADTVELIKMGVAPNQQGKGIGKHLLTHVIDDVKAHGYKHIWLLSNQKLTAAMKLYEKSGFNVVPLTQADQERYGRADISMTLTL